MRDDDHKKYIKLLLISWFLFLLLLTGVVIFFSWHLQDVATSSQRQVVRIDDHDRQIIINTEQISRLEELVYKIAEQSKVPGPQGERGDDGTDSISTHTETVREIPIKGEKGDRGDAIKFDDLTEEQKSELRALPIELCRWPSLPDIGWRYSGTTICMPIEVVSP